MTDRFSPSLPTNGKVKVSLARRVAGVVANLFSIRSSARRRAAAGPALVLWRFEYGALRLGLQGALRLGMEPPRAWGWGQPTA